MEAIDYAYPIMRGALKGIVAAAYAVLFRAFRFALDGGEVSVKICASSSSLLRPSVSTPCISLLPSFTSFFTFRIRPLSSSLHNGNIQEVRSK